MPREDQEEQEPAMSKYRFFMRWFSNNFVTIIDGCWVTPTYIFQKALVDFAAVVYKYKDVEHDPTNEDDTDRHFTPKAVYNHLRQHFLHNWPTLQSYFESAINNAGIWLSWQGSDITILPRTPEVMQDLATRGLHEKAYPPNGNIFEQIERSPNDTPAVINSQKRSRQDPTPPPTPSSGVHHGRKRTRKSSAIVVD